METGDVPSRDILVEATSPHNEAGMQTQFEHTFHTGDTRDVPIQTSALKVLKVPGLFENKHPRK
jgi:hypothetical protein